MLEGPLEGCCNQQVRERVAWNTVACVQTAVLGKTIERRGGWPCALSLQLHDVRTNASAKARFAAPPTPAARPNHQIMEINTIIDLQLPRKSIAPYTYVM